MCAELCGAGHSGMLFRVEAVSQTDFRRGCSSSKPARHQRAAATAGAGAARRAGACRVARASRRRQPAARRLRPRRPRARACPSAPGGDPPGMRSLIRQRAAARATPSRASRAPTAAIGPNLAGVASRNRIAGGAVPNNGPDDLKRWIMNPPALKPGTAMPNLGLTDDDATKIVAYLETLK